MPKSFTIQDSEVIYVDGLSGLRCWCCWRERGEVHDSACRVPFCTAVQDLKDAVMEKIEPALIKICKAITKITNWFERKFDHDHTLL